MRGGFPASASLTPVAALTQADLQAIVDAKAAEAPIAANRVAAALFPFCQLVAAPGLHHRGIGRELSKPTRERPRERILSLEEVGAIWRASVASARSGAPSSACWS